MLENTVRLVMSNLGPKKIFNNPIKIPIIDKEKSKLFFFKGEIKFSE